MKKRHAFTFIIILLNVSYWGVVKYEYTPITHEDIAVAHIVDEDCIHELDEWELMQLAIQKVESEFDPNAYNASSNAAGIYQQRPVYVKDANRIVGENHFTLADRFDPDKAQQMFDTIQSYYNPNKDIMYAINIHIKGVNGHKRNPNSCQWYVRRVMNAMEELRK